jgi:Domain of unknown function (DUF4032)
MGADETVQADEPVVRFTPPAPLRNVAIPRPDWARLRALPWSVPLEEWPERGVVTLTIRRGESRHPVLFVEAGRRRYAIKETSPEAAQREIYALNELQRRRCRALEPVGYVVVRGELELAGEIGGRPVYISGDTGYCVTRLAEHVLPQSVLYRYPFTEANKRLLWNAIAELLVELHESGVYWGDPSLANVLMDLSGQRLTAVMADAETAEIISGSLDEGLRRQDLESFTESLAWQAEDIRLARDLPEDEQLVTETDAEYVLSRYAGLRAARRHRLSPADTLFARLAELEGSIRRINTLGYGALMSGTRAVRSGLEEMVATVAPEFALKEENEAGIQIATLRAGWYVRRLRVLLGVRVPRAEAQRIYSHINVHKWLLSERAGRDVGMDTAARDWYDQYHMPLLAFLDSYLPGADVGTRYHVYADVLDAIWEMSKREQRPVSVEEGAMDYALAAARASTPLATED